MFDIIQASWREQPLIIKAGEEKVIYFTDSDPTYVIINNLSPNQIYCSRSSGVNQENYEFSVPPFANRQWGWSIAISELHIMNPSVGDAPLKLTSYTAPFNPVAVAQTGQNVIVANELNVASMPQVDVNIKGGSVIAEISNVANVNIQNVIYNKPVPNEISFISNGLLEWTVDYPILAADTTRNLLEVHLDLTNTGTSVNRVWMNLDKQATGKVFATPAIAAGTDQRIDLTFGSGGVGLDKGIWASCDFSNKINVSGYFITTPKPV